jgi:hypothetical protein
VELAAEPVLLSPLELPSLALALVVSLSGAVLLVSSLVPLELSAGVVELSASLVMSLRGVAQAASDMAARTGRQRPRGDCRGGASSPKLGRAGEATASPGFALARPPIATDCIEGRAYGAGCEVTSIACGADLRRPRARMRAAAQSLVRRGSPRS